MRLLFGLAGALLAYAAFRPTMMHLKECSTKTSEHFEEMFSLVKPESENKSLKPPAIEAVMPMWNVPFLQAHKFLLNLHEQRKQNMIKSI